MRYFPARSVALKYSPSLRLKEHGISVSHGNFQCGTLESLASSQTRTRINFDESDSQMAMLRPDLMQKNHIRLIRNSFDIGEKTWPACARAPRSLRPASAHVARTVSDLIIAKRARIQRYMWSDVATGLFDSNLVFFAHASHVWM
ncbi:hypothetical protein ACJJTC_001686 [Scirpophaga incertulas]